MESTKILWQIEIILSTIDFPRNSRGPILSFPKSYLYRGTQNSCDQSPTPQNLPAAIPGKMVPKSGGLFPCQSASQDHQNAKRQGIPMGIHLHSWDMKNISTLNKQVIIENHTFLLPPKVGYVIVTWRVY